MNDFGSHAGLFLGRFRRGAAPLAVAACLCLPSAAIFAQDANVQQQQAARNDADIQSDVNYALAHDATLKGQQITCTTDNGIVKLSGTVQTDAQYQQAETVAGSVPGVGGVLNNIKVTNPGSGDASAANAAIAAQEAANTPAPPPDTAQSNVPQSPAAAQSNVPPPPPDVQAPNQAPQGYSGPRPPYQPQSQPQSGYYPPANQQSYNAPPSGPVTVPAGTLLRIRLSETLDTARLKSGAFFQGTAAVDVYQNGVLAIPRGAVVQGQVVQAKNAGDLGGSAELQLQLTSLNLGGKVIPLTTNVWSNKGPNKAGYTAANTAGGAALGAIIGGIIGRGAGAAIGAGIGGVGGLAASSATHGPRLILPVESQVDFHLTAPVTVQPVSWQEAQRLASSVPQPPRLVTRPYPPPGYMAPYPYYPYYPYGAYPYYYGRVY